MRNFISYKTWLNEKISDGITVLFPGSFKPMHIGHINLIKRYLDHLDVKEIKVLIGPGIRNGITQKEALEIATLLLKDIPNVSIEAVKYPSPILTAYKYMETAEPGTYAMAGVRKGKDDEDYERVIKFVNDFAPGGRYVHTKSDDVKVIELSVNTEPIYYEGRTDEYDGKPISASILRQDILNNDYENFKTNYPGYDENLIKKIWRIVENVITEKFEKDSDPIHDMGIGMWAQIEKWAYNNKKNLENISIDEPIRCKALLDLCIIKDKLEFANFIINDTKTKFNIINDDRQQHFLRLAAYIGSPEMGILLIKHGADLEKAIDKAEEFNEVITLRGLKRIKELLEKEKINEKFEQDTDPIHDMGIGYKFNSIEDVIDYFNEIPEFAEFAASDFFYDDPIKYRIPAKILKKVLGWNMKKIDEINDRIYDVKRDGYLEWITFEGGELSIDEQYIIVFKEDDNWI